MPEQPYTTYSETDTQKRVVTDVISLIDPTDTPFIDRMGGLDGAASKFRLVNWPGTKVEWLEDTHFPLTDQLNGSIASNTTTLTLDNASALEPGDIIQINAEQMWVSAVSTSAETITVTRNFGGTQSSHADDSVVHIIGQARLEGAENAYRDLTDRTVGYNYTEIFHTGFKITRTQQQMSQYGIDDELEYQARKAVPALLRLIEKQLFRGVRKAGSASTPRTMGGLPVFVTDNTVSASGAITQAKVESATSMSFNDGGNGPWDMYVTMSNYQVIKNIYDSSNFLRVTTDETRIGLRIEQLVTPAGIVNIIPDRWAETSKAFLVDNNNVGMLTYYPFTRKELASTGDFVNAEVVGEFTFLCRQDKSHAALTGIV